MLSAPARDAPSLLCFDEIAIAIVRKPVKHLRISVRAPEGDVRATVPTRASLAAVREALREQLPWIRRQRARIASRVPAVPVAPREYADGETLWLLGKPRTIEIRSTPAARSRVVDGIGERVVLHLRHDHDRAHREAVLHSWYRTCLRSAIPPLLATWEPRIGVPVAAWGVRRMRTRWGSCNTKARRIWLSLELATRAIECVEYVLVHELAHLLERRHNARFYSLMDGLLPDWRARRALLNDPARGVPA